LQEKIETTSIKNTTSPNIVDTGVSANYVQNELKDSKLMYMEELISQNHELKNLIKRVNECH